MFDQQEYLIGWAVYLLASAVLLGVAWRWSAGWRLADLRNLVRLLLAAALLTPVATSAGSAYLAPAVVVALIESLVEEGSPGRALAPLMVFGGVGLAVTLILSLFRR